ncbi:MAG: radical SAM protein, partial [Terriglobales bacterium]
GLRDGLAQLLAELARVEGLDWVRTLYFYPNKITQRLLDTIAAHPRLCKYLDMPLQHASPAVLKRMRRGGGGEIFLKLLERIRRTIPGVRLRTTFIVGFPGETEADFQYLMDFVAEARFDWLGVFGYSDEETSRSHALPDKVDARIIARRRRQLMAAQRKISRQLRRRMIGQRVAVMVEGPAEETDLLWQGRLEGQAPEIDGKVWLNDFGADPQGEALAPPAVGRLAQVEITGADDYDVIGRVVPAGAP